MKNPSPATWPVEIVPTENVTAGVQLWRYRGKLHVTVIAKAMFTLVPGGEARPAPPEEVVRSAVHATSNPASPVLFERELAPWLPCAEVVFMGHAHAPGGELAARVPVRLAVLRDNVRLVDKRLEIVGDRFTLTNSNAPEPEPKPFMRMPIVYQRAWGGPGEPANPFGTGLISSGGRIVLPNILASARSRVPAGLGPIPPFWPAREQLLRGAPPPEIAPIHELVADFDGNYFHTVPEDQRFDSVRGGERIVLEGLHSQHPVLDTRLPTLRGIATLFLPNGEQRWFMLAGDSLILKGDTGRCAVLFRGHFQVAHENALAGIRVAVGIEQNGEPVAWPIPTEVPTQSPIDKFPKKHTDEPTRAFQAIDWSKTLTLDDNEIEAPLSAVPGGSVPFNSSLPEADATLKLPISMLGMAADAPAQTSYEAAPLTMPPQSNTRYLPIGPGLLDVDASAMVRAPFPIAPSGKRGDGDGGNIPGAPWATQQPAMTPLLGVAFLPIQASTLATDDLMPSELEPVTTASPRLRPDLPAVPPPIVTSPPEMPPAVPLPLHPRTADRNIWAESPPAAPAPPLPTAPKPSPAKPDLGGNMYKRFRKS